ncbi:MAG: hypothetical protein KF763_01220 [Cyclobacteriaceae bacterium]|nr:hypothetical protein [Cyclobacteriaceae bacterium]
MVGKKKVNVRLSGHVGLNRVSYADHLFATKHTPVLTDAQSADATLSLLYGTGVILTYPLNEKLRLGLNVGFFAGRATYKTTWKFGIPSNMASGPETVKQPIAAINSGLVISYELK